MKTIMVVDDESNVLEQVKSCLEEDDFEVITATDSRTALELMNGNKEDDFGLILIDTLLPGSKKSALFSMKPKSRIDINAGKAEDFLQKPFTKEQLLDFVKSKVK
jgi:DNA-binding response OmpR family regulator